MILCRTLRRAVLVTALCAPLLLGLSRAGAESRAVQQAQQYAQQHNFPLKTVTTGPANRQVRRTFVPITPQSYISFLQHFSAPNGFAHLNYNASNRHMAMGLQPPNGNTATDCYLWARNYNGTVQGIGDYRNMYMCHNNNGYCIGLDLQGPRLQHLSQWLAARNSPQDQLYRGGNCMEWLPNAEVGPGRALFHELGVRRSKDGGNMKAKLLHAGNQQVEVVGMFVPDVNTFNTMNDQQLLGPPPAGGIGDAAR